MAWINRALAVVATVALGGGCGDDEVAGPEPATFEELCGREGPTRILSIEVDPNLRSLGAVEVGDRYVLSLRSHDEAADIRTNDVWSVGRCGEDPISLVEDLDFFGLRVDPEFPDVVFICDEVSGWLTALDVHGQRPANEVIETRQCFARWTDLGVLTILGEGDTGPLVLQRWPEDPLAEAAEQVVLVDEVKARALPSPHTWPNEHEVLATVAGEAFAITAEDALVVVDLETLAVTELAAGVREFEVGGLGRWLVWQGVEITNDDLEWPRGPIFVLDRETGDITEIDETALAFTLFDTMVFERLGLLHYRVGGWGDDSADRWVELSSFETYEVPGGMQPMRAIDDTRGLLGRYFGAPYVVIDTTTATATTIYDGPAERTSHGQDGLLILTRDRGELVHVDYSGATRTLAPSVTGRYWIADDGRVVTPYAVGDDELGQLLIVDPATHDQRTIDHDVHMHSAVPLFAEGEPIVGYFVGDPDPERHGVWIAKPAR